MLGAVSSASTHQISIEEFNDEGNIQQRPNTEKCRKHSSMLDVVSSASTHHNSTVGSIPVEIKNAPYPLRKFQSMDIAECSAGPGSDILSNRNRDASQLLDVVSSTSEQQ